jgi:hypothetical protein
VRRAISIIFSLDVIIKVWRYEITTTPPIEMDLEGDDGSGPPSNLKKKKKKIIFGIPHERRTRVGPPSPCSGSIPAHQGVNH